MLKSNGHGNLMSLGWPSRFMLSYDFISTLNAQFAKLQELRNGDENIVFLTKMKSPVKKIEKKYRFQILLRVKDDINDDLLKKIFEICDNKTYKDVSVFVERNPQSLT